MLGGGPIGCELAQCFARFGSQVTQVEMLPRILITRRPRGLGRLVAQQFAPKASQFSLATRQSASSSKTATKALVRRARGQGGARFAFDEVLCAVGRTPNTKGYGLEELGIASHAAAHRRDQRVSAERSIPNIYACGDVAGPYQFTHTASHQAWYASVNALFGRFEKFRVDYSVIPWCTFTDPEVARVGLNETEAKEKGIAYEVTVYPIDDLDRAIADEEAHGMVKVLDRARQGSHPGRDHRRQPRRRSDHRVHHRDEARHRAQQDPRHDPHLSDNGRGQQDTLPASGSAHMPRSALLRWLERYHAWMRG